VFDFLFVFYILSLLLNIAYLLNIITCKKNFVYKRGGRWLNTTGLTKWLNVKHIGMQNKLNENTGTWLVANWEEISVMPSIGLSHSIRGSLQSINLINSNILINLLLICILRILEGKCQDISRMYVRPILLKDNIQLECNNRHNQNLISHRIMEDSSFIPETCQVMNICL